MEIFSESIPEAICGCISEGFPVGIPGETPLKAVVMIKKYSWCTPEEIP